MADIIDMASGIARFGGKKELYIRTLKKFVDTFPVNVQPFEEAISEENKSETVKLMHTLKGTSGNMGLNTLYQAIVSFENSMRNEFPDKKLYEAVFERFNEAKLKIESLI